MVGDQLDYGDNICGAVLSIRFSEDILSVWNRNSADHQVCNLKQLLTSLISILSYVVTSLISQILYGYRL